MFVFAMLMSSGTPSPRSIWLRAKTAFFFTSVSGSFSMASLMTFAIFWPAFWASQNSACERTSRSWSCRAIRISSGSASGTLLSEIAKVVCSRNFGSLSLRTVSRRISNPRCPRALPSQNAACSRNFRGRCGPIKVASAASAEGSLWKAIAVSAPSARLRSPRSSPE